MACLWSWAARRDSEEDEERERRATRREPTLKMWVGSAAIEARDAEDGGDHSVLKRIVDSLPKTKSQRKRELVRD